MVPLRPRRTAIRRVLLVTLLVAIAPIASATLGPAMSAPRLTGPIIAPPPSLHPGVGREEPDIIHAPAPDVSIPTVAPIGRQPRGAEGPSATLSVRVALKARLDRIRSKYGIPGLSVTIIFPDGTRWLGTSGYADVDGKVPVTPDTAFALASVSKTFTGALIMALAEEGKVVIDAPARTYLPGMRLDPKITVRQLLDHTSGLRDYFLHPAIDKILLAQRDRRWTEQESMKYVGKPYFKPGRGWHYSNTNYLLLGMIAERAGRAPLADQLRERFYEPLGLDRTFFQPTEAPRGPVAHGYRFKTAAVDAKPIDLGDGTPIVPFTSVVTAAAGAGALAATSSDVARWARALYGGAVLEEDSVQEMVDDVARTERYRPAVPYGLGVQLIDVAERPTLGHSGRLLGFRSVVRWLPEEGIAIAVLTNQSRTDPGIIARALLRIALRPPAECQCLERR